MKRVICLNVLVMLLLFVSCKGDDMLCCPQPNISNTNCALEIVVNEVAYNQLQSASYTITNAQITGNCLSITISTSGCNPDNWIMNLVASEVVVEPQPNQINTKVILVNNEACTAVFQKTVAFNISALQITNQNQVQINLPGWSTPLMYQY